MRNTARITSAGPTKTYGRTPSRESRREPVDEPVHRPEQREHAADTDDERDGTTSEPVGVGVAQEVERTSQRSERRRATATTSDDEQPPRSRGQPRCGPLRRLSVSLASCRSAPARGSFGRPRSTTGSGQLSSMSCRTLSRLSGPSFMYSTIAGPEAALPDRGRHQVGGVEAPGAVLERDGEDHRRVGQDVVGVAVRADVDVRRDPRRRRRRRPSRTARPRR